MKAILIYYPFAIPLEANSASMLRPIEMLHAFRTWGGQEGIAVHLISGTSSERAEQFKTLVANGSLDQLLFCYVENRTIPIWLTDPSHMPKDPWVDRRVFRFLTNNKVPIGIFYRDVYWKFPELYPLKGLKKSVMKRIYQLEERFYSKYGDIIFVPSQEMITYLSMNRPKIDLPPGGKDVGTIGTKSNAVKRGIYVGGIRHDTGIDTLLDAIDIIHKKGIPFSLTVICREKEYQNLNQDVKHKFEKLSIDVQHKSGNELDQIYRQVDVGFIPFHRNTYNDFAIPYKLFEYLSYQLPVIATDCTAHKKIVEQGYGLVCEDNPESMANSIEQMLKEENNFQSFIQQHFMEQHSWLARVNKVKEVLTNLN